MDPGIGKIVDELKEKDINENAIILFLQDNGGCAEGIGFIGKEGEMRLTARDTAGFISPGKENLQTTIILLYNRKGQVMMGGKKVMPGSDDTYLTYLRLWAMVSNIPFKKCVHEGEISRHLIVNWPAGIKSKGVIREQVGSGIEIMPTIVEIAEAKSPKYLMVMR